MQRLLRYIKLLWALPASMLGLACACAARITGGHAWVVEGALEVWGGAVSRALAHRLPFVGSGVVMTLGHVVIGPDVYSLQRARAHERVHVRQYERWGPFFIPAYLLASLAAWARGRHPYLDNPFEKQAYLQAEIGG